MRSKNTKAIRGKSDNQQLQFTLTGTSTGSALFPALSLKASGRGRPFHGRSRSLGQSVNRSCSLSLAAEDSRGACDVRLIVGRFGFRIASVRRGSVFERIARSVSFAGCQKQVRLQAVLLGVELKISAARGIEGFVRPAFDNLACLDHQDLVGPADR